MVTAVPSTSAFGRLSRAASSAEASMILMTGKSRPSRTAASDSTTWSGVPTVVDLRSRNAAASVPRTLP